MNRFVSLIVMILVVMGLSAVDSSAGVKKIRPDQLIAERSEHPFRQSPTHVRCGNSDGCFWNAVVNLPIGKTVTNVTYYHYGTGTGSPYTICWLNRVKMGEQMETIAVAASTDSSTLIKPIQVSSITNPKIIGGYTYFIRVYSQDLDSQIMGIKVTYK